MPDFAQRFMDRFSTPLIADAAFRAGAELRVPSDGPQPLDRAQKLAGRVATVEANNDLVAILGALHAAAPGEVLVIANSGYPVGVMGDLVATEAARRGLGGFVIDGMARDSTEIIEIGVPTFCRGVIPIGPLKVAASDRGTGRAGVPVGFCDVTVTPGDWVFGDADGVVFIGEADLPSVFEWAERSWEREEALAAEIQAGEALGDLLGIPAFLEKRATDPGADFNAHLIELGRAI